MATRQWRVASPPQADKFEWRVARIRLFPLAPLLVILVLFRPCVAAPQASPSHGVPAPAHAAPPKPAAATPQTKPDYSREPFVVESLITRARFENDGTGRVETTARIRVQSDSGVQALGQLVFPFNSATERLEIAYVRVRRADGSAITASPESMRDLSAQAVRDAPLYSDAREKHVTVPALHPGETLEYESAEIIFQPIIPGQFWFEYEFEKNAITLDQKLELDVPAGRALKMKAPASFEPRVSEEAGRRICRWSSSHSSREDDATKQKAPSKQPVSPDVRISTFASWEEIGAWYQSLERARVAVTPEIQKKADELTQSRATPLEKLEALYGYVARNIRYVRLPFGAGGFEPHATAAILKNEYGDSKDEHALLAALAAAEGLKADAVLMHSQRNLDPDMPSPAGLDHVISRVRVGNDEIWLDTTTEVAPFRFLPSYLRHKRALAVPPDGSAVLVETPADPPFPVHQLWRLDGTVDGLGKLDARIHYMLGGDNEFLLRLAFRRTPQTKWKELGQAISASDGLRGVVEEVTPSDASDTHHAFTLDYHLVQPGFLDWSSRRVELPPLLPALALPEAKPEADGLTGPIELGSPAEVTMEMSLSLPARYSARAPAAISVARDYGEYRSAYSVAGEVLTASRTLNIRQREIPADRTTDYALFFRRAVRNDEAQTFFLESTAAGAPVVPETASAEDLVQAATRAYGSQQFRLAEQLLERAVALDPKHKRAWKLLGAVRLAQQENVQAAEAFRKQIELQPQDEFAYEGLGLAQAAQKQYDDAIASFRKQLEVKPLDPMAQASLGATLGEAQRYAEAVRELEKAISLTPEDPRLYVNLGRAELNLNHAEKALTAFDKVRELGAPPSAFNTIARELMLRGVSLDRAQQYAESAVAATTAELRNVSLDHLTLRDLDRVSAISAFWDTLAWIYFRRGDVKRAEPFGNASWQLNFQGEVADHLGQIYEKQGRTEDAKRAYALALAAPHPETQARERLEVLAGGTKQADALVAAAQKEIVRLREYSVGRLIPESSSGAAEFFLLLGPGSNAPEAVKFIRGDSALRGAAEKLRALDYGRMIPDGSLAKLVRRGTLSCAEGKQSCTFTLIPADQVHSLE